MAAPVPYLVAAPVSGLVVLLFLLCAAKEELKHLSRYLMLRFASFPEERKLGSYSQGPEHLHRQRPGSKSIESSPFRASQTVLHHEMLTVWW